MFFNSLDAYRHPTPWPIEAVKAPSPHPVVSPEPQFFSPLLPQQKNPQLQDNQLRIGKKPNPEPSTSAGRGKLLVTMTTYAERESRRHAWTMAHPVETTPLVERYVDMPVGIVDDALAPDKEKRTHPLLLVGIVALAPVWLPLWGIYLLHEEWNRWQRPTGSCLTYHPALRNLKG